MEYNLEEYRKGLNIIDDWAEQKKRSLVTLFAKNNNPYQIGDTITDHIGSLKIESVVYSRNSYNELPCCIYFGIELKKDGTPMKRQSGRGVYQNNIQE